MSRTPKLKRVGLSRSSSGKGFSSPLLMDHETSEASVSVNLVRSKSTISRRSFESDHDENLLPSTSSSFKIDGTANTALIRIQQESFNYPSTTSPIPELDNCSSPQSVGYSEIPVTNSVQSMAAEKPGTAIKTSHVTPAKLKSSREIVRKRKFQSPVLKQNAVVEKKQNLVDEEQVNRDIDEYIKKGFKFDDYDKYIKLLHDYNDAKDAAQIIFGRLAELEGITAKTIHYRYGMNATD